MNLPTIAAALAGEARSGEIAELIRHLTARRSEVLDRLADVGPPRRHEEPAGARRAALLAGDVATIERFDAEAATLSAELAIVDSQLPELARQRDLVGDRETVEALPGLIELLDAAVGRAERAADTLNDMLNSVSDRFDDLFRARVRSIRARLPAAAASAELIERIQRLQPHAVGGKRRCFALSTDVAEDIGAP